MMRIMWKIGYSLSQRCTDEKSRLIHVLQKNVKNVNVFTRCWPSWLIVPQCWKRRWLVIPVDPRWTNQLSSSGLLERRDGSIIFHSVTAAHQTLSPIKFHRLWSHIEQSHESSGKLYVRHRRDITIEEYLGRYRLANRSAYHCSYSAIIATKKWENIDITHERAGRDPL